MSGPRKQKAEEGRAARQERADQAFKEASEPAWGEGESSLAGVPRARTDYVPARFRGASESAYADPGPAADIPPVPDNVRWAAAYLIAQLTPLAKGEPHPPAHGARRPAPDAPPARSITTFSLIELKGGHHQFTSGSRQYTATDGDSVMQAFEAWTKVPLDRAWKVVLADQLRSALLVTQFARMSPIPRVTPDGDVVAPMVPPTPSQILDDVRQRCPPGQPPKWVTAKVIEVGLTQTTDARRGGGRGNKNKRSVEQWIDSLETIMVQEVQKARAAPKKRGPQP